METRRFRTQALNGPRRLLELFRELAFIRNSAFIMLLLWVTDVAMGEWTL